MRKSSFPRLLCQLLSSTEVYLHLLLEQILSAEKAECPRGIPQSPKALCDIRPNLWGRITEDCLVKLNIPMDQVLLPRGADVLLL